MTQGDHQTLATTFRNEQHDLHHQIDDWREWWNELSELGEPRFGEMHDRVQSIRNHLATHFHHEEESGIFQEISNLKPKHAQQATQLLSDHQKLLNDLNRLCARLGTPEPEYATWGDARRSFEDFLDELEIHERNENALMDLWAESDGNSS